jgi:transposase-like protein
MKIEDRTVHTGDCCLNPTCELYGQVGLGNIRKNGHTKQNRQRYQCTTCHRTHSERTGTVFYRLHTEESKVVDTLSSLARGSRIGAVAQTQGFKDETVIKWLKRAGAHAEHMEEVLFANYPIGPGEIDGLWTYVGHKGEKKQP